MDFGFNIEQDTALRRINRSVSHVEFYQSDGLLVFRNHESLPSVRDLSPLILKAQSMGDKSYHELALAMRSYTLMLQKTIDSNAEGSRRLLLNDLGLAKYEENYRKFEEWALNSMRKREKNEFLTFSIKKFNPVTLELETRLSGQSEGMLALRGLDINNPANLFLARKENYHYLDGESNLRLLISQLHSVIYPKKKERLKTTIITFDELKIDVTHSCSQITNRDSSYPFSSE